MSLIELTPNVIELLPKQVQVMESTKPVIPFICGIGSGKTFVGAHWSWKRLNAGRHVIGMEPTAKMLKRVMIPEMRKSADELGMIEGTHYKVNESDFLITLSNGSMFQMHTYEAYERMRGENVHDAWLDEIAEAKTREPFKLVKGRTRLDENAQILGTGTTKPRAWLKDWLDQYEPIRMHTMENWHLPKQYIQGLKDEYGEGSLWWRQEVLGELIDFTTGVIEASAITICPAIMPIGNHPVRAWDTASSARTTADFTASGLLSKEYSGKITIHDVTNQHGTWATIRDSVIQRMQSDPPGTVQIFENTQGGQVIMSDLLTDPRCHGINIQPVQAIRDKVTRALPFSGRVTGGLVQMCQAPWNQPLIDQMNSFGPDAEHDDMVDAIAHAYNSMEHKIPVRMGNI